MGTTLSTLQRVLAAAFVTVGLASGVAHAQPYASPYVKSSLMQVDVYDRADASALPVYEKDGRHYVVGVPGHEYAVRIRNCTASRILDLARRDPNPFPGLLRFAPDPNR